MAKKPVQAPKPLLNDPDKYTPEPDFPPEDEEEKIRKLREELKADEAERSFDPKPDKVKVPEVKSAVQRVITTPAPTPVITKPEPVPETKPVAESITKTEAVKRALAAGMATASVGVPWIEQTFGIAINANTFSTTKNNLGKKGNTVTSTRPPAPTTHSAPRPAARPLTSSTAPATASGSPADMIREIRGVLNKYGASEVREVIDALEGN